MAKAVVREVKILDAVLKEDEGTEDEPKIEQYIWLQLLDVKSEKSFTTSLSLEDIKELTGMSRYLVNLKSREAPLFMVFNPDDEEITAEMIKNEEGI